MIYFITARDLCRVKIGFSSNPRVRFAKMQSDSPVSLTLERVTVGGVDVERLLHAQFASARVAGEWFDLSPEIEAHMTTLPEPQTRKVRGATLKEKARAIGISQSYASEILSGHRKPSRPLAIHIMRRTGWRHEVLDGLSDEQIDVLESVEPWVPTQDRAA